MIVNWLPTAQASVAETVVIVGGRGTLIGVGVCVCNTKHGYRVTDADRLYEPPNAYWVPPQFAEVFQLPNMWPLLARDPVLVLNVTEPLPVVELGAAPDSEPEVE